MPDLPQVTVCVIALTLGDYKDLDPAVQTKLALFFASPGKPYHKSSPDEWQPFTMDSVTKYLENARIQASFLSVQLEGDKAARSKVLKQTGLCIIDPLVLMHGVKGGRLAGEIQDAIYQGDKAFCIILAGSNDPLWKEVEDSCRTKLDNLWASLKDQDTAELVLTHHHLEKYLSRLARLLTAKPDQTTLALAQAILNQMGVPAPNLNQAPHLGKGLS